ncbi:MAG: hypothetical protein KC729_16320, partial [Candidatus Eisenbacteria bacterium]|nr:hypothetical protein [Candidatus Eisenbacteria bacterium]
GDPSRCVIDCQSDGRAFYIHNGEGPDTVIEGIGIVRGRVVGSASGGGIACVGTSPTIRNCVISGCKTASAGSGGGLLNSGGEPLVEGCTIAGNWSDHGGGVRNDNHGRISLVRTIVFGNCAFSGAQISNGTGVVNLECCDIEPEAWDSGAEVAGGLGADPLFCSPNPCTNVPSPNGSYHLQPGSPCLPEASPCGELIGALGADCGPEGIRVCCLPGGQCIETDETDCLSQGGTFRTDVSACIPLLCDPDGACCLENGVCGVMSFSECEIVPGYWLGVGAPCDPSPCIPVTSDCLFVDFDTDDDPWTIQPLAHATSADFRWVFQCPNLPPIGYPFELYIRLARCRQCSGCECVTGVEMTHVPGMDPAFVESWETSNVPFECGVSLLDGVFAGDAPFVPGERYFIGTSHLDAICGEQDPCTPEGPFFEVFYVYQGCDGVVGSLDCVSVPPSGTPEDEPSARVFLASPIPNPTVDGCDLRFGLVRESDWTLRIVDVAGRDVVSLGGRLGPGIHTRRWNGRDAHGREVPSGVYQVRLDVEGIRLEESLVRLR